MMNPSSSSANLFFTSLAHDSMCSVCGWNYDPAIGDPGGGITAGKLFEKYRMTRNVLHVVLPKVALKRYNRL